MGATLRGHFETRRDAEMVVERLVQEHGIERTDIIVVAPGTANTAGQNIAGSDAKAAESNTDRSQDAALNGPIEVSVDIQDDAKATSIRSAFTEFGVHDTRTN